MTTPRFPPTVKHEPHHQAPRPVVLPKPPMRQLRANAAGQDVMDLQSALVRLDLPVWIDGVMGPHTVAAVMKFQERVKLAQTGIVDTATWSAMMKALA